MRIENPYYQVIHRSLLPFVDYPDGIPTLKEYFHGYRCLQRELATTPPASHPGPEKLTVILLSFKRVRNMETIVSTMLHTDFVEKVIVSNNNPKYRIADWVRLRDPRLRLIDQPRLTPPGIRIELARQEPGPYYLSVDDDVLMFPGQVLRLFQHLLADPSVPHGFQGEVKRNDGSWHWNGGWEVNLRGDRRVDNLNCVYAFHRDHLDQMERLAPLAGIGDAAAIAAMTNCEDILISAGGTDRPLVHDLGEMLLCLSSHRAGVATWRSRKNFFDERKEIFTRLRELTPRDELVRSPPAG